MKTLTNYANFPEGRYSELLWVLKDLERLLCSRYKVSESYLHGYTQTKDFLKAIGVDNISQNSSIAFLAGG
jgi:hypothetical protein